MKKILGLFSLLVYMVSTNALIHAQSMGILPDHEMMGMSSCHGHHTTSSSSAQQTIDCCELVTSNQYSQVQIKFSVLQSFSCVFSIKNSSLFALGFVFQPVYPLMVNDPPGWAYDIKYQAFSDLVGIVVDLA